MHGCNTGYNKHNEPTNVLMASHSRQNIPGPDYMMYVHLRRGRSPLLRCRVVRVLAVAIVDDVDVGDTVDVGDAVDAGDTVDVRDTVDAGDTLDVVEAVDAGDTIGAGDAIEVGDTDHVVVVGDTPNIRDLADVRAVNVGIYGMYGVAEGDNTEEDSLDADDFDTIDAGDTVDVGGDLICRESSCSSTGTMTATPCMARSTVRNDFSFGSLYSSFTRRTSPSSP